MRVALISLARGNYLAWNVGLLSLASWAHTHSRHRVRILDARFGDPVREIGYPSPDVIGIGAMTAQWEEACRMARDIKKEHPGAKCIVGGVHITALPETPLRCFDGAIRGEAEQNLVAYLDGRGCDSVPPLNLSEYPALDYDLIDRRYFRPRWLNIWSEMGTEGMTITSRGCPYRCPFCATTRFWNGVRYFPVDWVVRDIREQAARGCTHIGVHDDLFTINKRRLRRIIEALEAEGLAGLKYSGSSKASLLDDEICELLNRMNFQIINFGFESGNRRVLQYLKAGTTTPEDNERAVRLCVKHGLRPIGSLIFGAPGETRRQRWDTVRFAYKAAWMGADSLFYAPLTPFPGTPVWDDAKAKGEVNANMDFDQLSFFSERRGAIPRPVAWAMFLVRAFMKVRRMARITLGKLFGKGKP